LHSPLAWSPDGEWLSFTVVERAGESSVKPGWLFDTRSPSLLSATFDPSFDEGLMGDGVRYRIWATERSTHSSVLIEESKYPLSAPIWGPDGRSLLYCRFQRRASVSPSGQGQGRCEVVLQEALDRKRVICSFSDIELDREQILSFPEIQLACSPDGQYLAVPRPGRTASIAIVRVDRGVILETLDSASHPSWSPDGSKLAFVRPGRKGVLGSQSLHVTGLDFGQGRSVAEVSDMTEPPVWSTDGQSILAIARRPQSRSRDLSLVRVLLDSRLSLHVLPLASLGPQSQRMSRMPSLELETPAAVPTAHVSMGLDRDQEQCVFSVEIEGQPPQIVFGNVNRPMTYKRFHPLDINMRLGALALMADAQSVAVRVETPGKSGPPLLCDLSSETPTLIVPDSSIRQEWIVALVDSACGLLRAGVPQPTFEGRRVERATWLPVPGEIPDQSPLIHRLRRLGKVGRALLDQSQSERNTPAGDEQSATESLDEFRLFFDYIRQDYAAAETDLEAIESRATSPDLRLKILGLRAQILQAQGQSYRARPIADYLLGTQASPSRRVEETPLGPVFSENEDAGGLWPRYLSKVLAEKSGAGRTARAVDEGDETERADQPLTNPLDALDWRAFDRGASLLQRQRQLQQGFDPRQMGRPFGPERQPRFFPPPAPPRPVNPLAPILPRFRNSDRPVFNR
jgi:hypothetical protein